jgi:hypothetical protein
MKIIKLSRAISSAGSETCLHRGVGVRNLIVSQNPLEIMEFFYAKFSEFTERWISILSKMDSKNV